MNPQISDIQDLEGTYIFDVSKSVKAFRLNKFLWMHREPSFRALVVADPTAAFDQLALTPQERHLIETRDWLGLIRYGVSFFVLEKFARVARVSNLQVYASMRGESLEAFLKTRRVPASA
jgi:hypothetical protein